MDPQHGLHLELPMRRISYMRGSAALLSIVAEEQNKAGYGIPAIRALGHALAYEAAVEAGIVAPLVELFELAVISNSIRRGSGRT